MKHLYNTSTQGIYQDHTGKISTGPKCIDKMPELSPKQKYDLGIYNLDDLRICGLTWAQIQAIQNG